MASIAMHHADKRHTSPVEAATISGGNGQAAPKKLHASISDRADVMLTVARHADKKHASPDEAATSPVKKGNGQTDLVAAPKKIPASISDRADVMLAVLKEMQARAYAYRVQINEGLVYVTANPHNALQEAFSKTKSNTLMLHANAKSIFAKKEFQVSALSAAGGAAVMGAGGGAVGMTAGFWIGGAIGILPALLTFGLSIPVGAAIGAGTGLVVGTAAGSSAGALGGGAVGYGVYSKRQQIGGAVEHAHNPAAGKVQHARAKTT